jgi:hypothetical protein
VFYTDDAERDFLMQDMEQARREERLPVCDNRKCRKKINDDFCWEIDGEILCEKCMNLRYRKWTEDYIQID